MIQKRILAIASVAAVGLLHAQALEINVTPGGLESKIESLGGISDNTLTLKGHADVRDLMLLATLPATVKTLDLSQLEIDEYASAEEVFEGRNYFKAKELPCYIFFKSPAEKIICPNKITSIDDGAFAGAKVKEVVLPDGLRNIGDHVFYDCNSLTTINMPASLQNLGMWSFARCTSLRNIDMSQTAVSELAERTFTGCESLVSIEMPDNLNSLGKEVFAGTAVKSLDLNGVNKADDYALVGMSQLQDVTLHKSGSYGQGMLMANANLQSISGMPVDMPRLFAANCSRLTVDNSVVSVASVGEYALACTKAQYLKFGKNLTNLEKGALRGVTGIKEIWVTDLENRVPATDEDAFEGLDCKNITLVVNNDCYDVWASAPLWSEFNIVKEVNSGVAQTPADADSVKAVCSGKMLIVESGEPVSLVEIYSIDGRRLVSANPEMTIWSRDMSGCDEKIIVVKVVTDNFEKTFKLGLR